MLEKQKTIGVFFGSRSPEHDVSIITAQLIIAELRAMGRFVMPVYISREGDWYLGEEFGSIEFFRMSPQLKKHKKYSLELAAKGTMVFRQQGLFGKSITIDIAFPALHGQNGEDGTIQGMFELLGVPYVGCGVAASALAMDKVLTKEIYRANNIPTTSFVWFTRAEWERNKDKILSQIRSELAQTRFVKPARLGSSIGIARTQTEEALVTAIEVALHYDDKIIVEEAVPNVIDVTCSLLGNDIPQVSLLQESTFVDAFFSYNEKYLKEGGTQLGNAKNNIIIPARLPEDVAKHVQELSLQVFRLVGCSGIARVDSLYDQQTGQVFINEINTLPGTLYHHLWEKSGVPLRELLERLLQLAQEKHEQKEKLVTTFTSTILDKADWSGKLSGKLAGRTGQLAAVNKTR